MSQVNTKKSSIYGLSSDDDMMSIISSNNENNNINNNISNIDSKE